MGSGSKRPCSAVTLSTLYNTLTLAVLKFLFESFGTGVLHLNFSTLCM